MKMPFIDLSEFKDECIVGWKEISSKIKNSLPNQKKVIVVLECYHGILNIELNIEPDLCIDTGRDVFKSPEEISKMVYPDVTDDRIFGFMTRLNVIDFLDKEKLDRVRKKIAATKGLIFVYGTGASLVVPEPDLFLYADMARWELQLRQRKHLIHNLGVVNKDDDPARLYKQGYFVDWRACDRLKKEIFSKVDFFLDTNSQESPKLVAANILREGMRRTVHKPFSVVPFFDPGPWGGQWMKKIFELDASKDNYAWCFNCVPEENSLYFKFGENLFEIPSINLVFFHPIELLGDMVHARFGDEFPIRFDYLDTMDGGNLSLQVHPLTEYIQEKFGVHYTQDESYYIMEAGEGASVYLGLKEGVDPVAMLNELKSEHFDTNKYVASFPAKKHDHFLIPAGTVHCSGKNCVVLEISATPYIFTFKLWDWGRMGLDGKPRPINIEHGKKVIQWDRTENWTKRELINRFERLTEAEERTGLHEREFIETRRHSFTETVHHKTNGSVNVLNLVEGEQIIVGSPQKAFEDFVVSYAETFIVPASVTEYTIKPAIPGRSCITIKAYVRT